MNYNLLRVLSYAFTLYCCITGIHVLYLIGSWVGMSQGLGITLVLLASLVAVLLLSKWYFRASVLPTVKEGAVIGSVSILFMIVCSYLMYVLSVQVTGIDGSVLWYVFIFGNPIFPLLQQPYVPGTLGIMLLGAIYAGYEFDGTYTGGHNIKQ